MAQGDWFVVAVAPKAEESVHKRSTELGIPAYFPTGLKVVKRRRRHMVVMRLVRGAAMPGYVFVQAGESQFDQYRRDYDAVDSVPHCLGWLRGGDGPEPVEPAAIDKMRQREAGGEYDSAAAQGRYWAPRWMRPGTMLRVTAGPFMGKKGEFWRMTAARRVSLFLEMLGAMCLTEVDLDAVARVR